MPRPALSTLVPLLTLLPILAACPEPSNHDRWVTTSNTNAKIDWDAVGKAYREAEGPADFEKKVNEIYTGDEVISVSVQDKDTKTQLVTGFFDKNKNGQVEESEKIFQLQRDIHDDKGGQYRIQGYGHYGHYHSPAWSFASDMMMGAMIANAFRPNYVPVYTTAYVTTPTRASNIRGNRQKYRAKHPNKFKRPTVKSRSGRSYGGTSRSRSTSSSRSRSSGGSRSRSFGGGSFGITSRRRKRTRVRLDS